MAQKHRKTVMLPSSATALPMPNANDAELQVTSLLPLCDQCDIIRPKLEASAIYRE